MKSSLELAPDRLSRSFAPEELAFQTTAELTEEVGIVGQPRALAALEFGLGMVDKGYHVFALGAPATGKQTLVLQTLRERARLREIPTDLCYVHNFENPRKPRLLVLPPGRGIVLWGDMERLIEDLRAAIAGALEGEDYQKRRQAIHDESKARPEKEFAVLAQEASKSGLALVGTPAGFVVAAVRGEEILSGEALAALPEEERKRIQEKSKTLEEEVQRILRHLPIWARERRGRLRDLEQETTRAVVSHSIEEARQKYSGLADVLRYLEQVEKDVIEHAQQLVDHEPGGPEVLMEMLGRGAARPPPLRRYRVNVLVDNGATGGAPVVFEDNPTYDNLLGRMEHTAQFGTLSTDFLLIRPGALHRARGGYLVLQADKLFHAPFVWEALKRALQARRVRIESLGEMLGLSSTVTLDPEPTPLEVQVVLLGEPLLYHLLCALDPEFAELFKVPADFADEVPATPENRRRYAALIATLARKHGLRPLDRAAVIRVMERSCRQASDQEKLTARIGLVLDWLREANYWAGVETAAGVTAAHVQRAIDAQIGRADRIRERLYEEIGRRGISIDTDGRRVGQVNGLSVAVLGNFAFGYPVRITARVRAGRGDVVDIEREVELSGPIHSKGVLILAGYLGARYALDRPLSLHASLVFEQSYGGIEGDSASAAELFALISAIANVPITQEIAVTGSVNQHGEIQVVGGINEKVEGFFDVCRARGLTGRQGVIVPATNARHLMLRQDVIESVRQGQFHVYAVETVDQGLHLLTGMEPSERDATGRYPEGTLNNLVESRLVELAETWHHFQPGAAAYETA
ncbi:MAG: AAA family ATPase [Gemmatimonadetes bacterium]|nr:AAA family ATPase [Gemmatimonadota bacterium]